MTTTRINPPGFAVSVPEFEKTGAGTSRAEITDDDGSVWHGYQRLDGTVLRIALITPSPATATERAALQAKHDAREAGQAELAALREKAAATIKSGAALSDKEVAQLLSGRTS